MFEIHQIHHLNMGFRYFTVVFCSQFFDIFYSFLSFLLRFLLILVKFSFFPLVHLLIFWYQEPFQNNFNFFQEFSLFCMPSLTYAFASNSIHLTFSCKAMTIQSYFCLADSFSDYMKFYCHSIYLDKYFQIYYVGLQ